MTRRQRGEGSIYKRSSDGKWVGTIYLGVVNKKRKRKTVYGRTQAEVVKKLRDARKEVDKGVTVTRSIRLEDWLNRWLTIASKRTKPKTLATYRSYVDRYLIPALGRVRLDKLTTQHVRDLHDYVYSLGLTSTTAGHAHAILSTALADAMRDDLVSRNVAAIESAPSNEEAQRRPLTLGEFGRFMAAVGDDRMASRWLFGFLTGARQGEVLGLRWESADLDAGVVDLATQLQRIPYKHGCGSKRDGAWPCGRRGADRCPSRALDVRPGFWHKQLDGNLCLQRPKTKGSTRVIPLPAVLIEALRHRESAYLGEKGDYATDHGLVWARLDGRPIDSSDDREEWTNILKDVGIPHTQQHSMRHATSSIMAALKVEEHVRMSILGHSEEATNRRYTHVDLTQQRAAMDTLGAAVMKELAG